jgi:hypothetical protein
VLRRAPIASFWSEFIGGQPGNFAYQMWQVARWSDDYAVVYAISDLAGQGWPFPWILGFVELAAVERSFIKFLRAAGQMYDIGFYASSASVEGDWPLATVALTGSDDLDGFPDWGVVDSLLSLEAEEIRALMDESALLGSADVLDRVSALLRQAIDAGLEGQDIKSLLTKADAGWSLDLLEDFLERCADE